MSPITAWPPAPVCDDARECILVVEDELLIRFMLSDGLRDEGFHVIEACDADEALTILGTTLPDMMISDVRMPGSMDGLGLMKAAREIFPALPVIIMSGHIMPGEAMAAGANCFVAKPFFLEAVFEAVRDALGETE